MDVSSFPSRPTPLTIRTETSDRGTLRGLDDEEVQEKGLIRKNVPTKSRATAYDTSVILVLALHVLVVLFYATLLIVWATGSEYHVVVNSEDAAQISTILNACLQVFILILTTALIAVMQPLAIRTQFKKCQTLTALSDVSSSWNGLGMSALTLYHNVRFPAAFFQVLLITSYLLALTALHTTTPLIFSVPIVNTLSKLPMSTLISTPNMRYLFPSNYTLPSNLSDVRFDWSRSSAAIDFLSGNVTIDYPGLNNNRVYDTLVHPLSSTNASVSVPYTDFHVACGQASQDPTISTNLSDITYNNDEDLDHPYYSSSLTISLENAGLGTLLDTFQIIGTWIGSGVFFIGIENVTKSLWAPAGVLVRIPHYIPPVPMNNGRNIFLYSVYNVNSTSSSPILDSSGSPGGSLFIPVVVFDKVVNRTYELGIHTQVIGCSLSTTSGSTLLDATTNRLVDVPKKDDARQRMWEDWSPDLTISNSLEDMWAGMFTPQSSMTLWQESHDTTAKFGAEWSCMDSFDLVNANASQMEMMAQSCHIPTVVEQYLTDALYGSAKTSAGWRVEDEVPLHTDFSDATLVTLEDALARATAMMMWAAARVHTLSTFTTLNETILFKDNQTLVASGKQQYDPEPQSGSAMVQETVLRGQLSINFIVLALGAAASVIILVIAVYILLPHIHTTASAQASAPLDGVSLLQISSLDTSRVTERLMDVDPNAMEARRRAGMFVVMVVDGRLIPFGEVQVQEDDGVVVFSAMRQERADVVEGGGERERLL